MGLATALATGCFYRNFRMDGTVGSMGNIVNSERDQDLNLAYTYLIVFYVSLKLINYFYTIKIVNTKS